MLLPTLRRRGITHTHGINSSSTEPSICARHAATPLRMGREGITPGLPPSSGDARLARARRVARPLQSRQHNTPARAGRLHVELSLAQARAESYMEAAVEKG
jgi:hypothetical protein